jgi:hypothetical protein
VARIGEDRNVYKVLVEGRKEGDHSGGRGVDGRKGFE